jgi:methyltransferase (TIGR00027 family)
VVDLCVRPTEPSLTARGVALARSRLQRPAASTGDPDGDVALARSLADDAEQLRSAGGREARSGDRRLVFIEARTRFFDDAVLGAIERGVTQIVILGAGYDGRALRFRTPGVRFFEVDHPATQADKRERLARLHVDTDGIGFIAADFTEPGLDARLAEAGHQLQEPTQYLLEGVLRYLPEAAIRDLLVTARRRAAKGSELAVSISTRLLTEDHDVLATRLAAEQRLADAGEAVLTVPSREIALGWLGDAGWAVHSVADLDHRPGRILVRATA